MKEFKFLTDRRIKWTMGSGQQIHIQEMTTEHICNVIRCLLGMGNVEIPRFHAGKDKSEWHAIFRNELNRRQTQ